MSNRKFPLETVGNFLYLIGMSEIEAFRARVEAFISDRGWTPTRFGREAARDPLFVFQLRDGREPRSATRQRVSDFMDEDQVADRSRGAAA